MLYYTKIVHKLHNMHYTIQTRTDNKQWTRHFPLDGGNCGVYHSVTRIIENKMTRNFCILLKNDKEDFDTIRAGQKLHSCNFAFTKLQSPHIT